MTAQNENVVSRLDSYTHQEHVEKIEQARQRLRVRREARRQRARAAAARLRHGFGQDDPSDA